MPKYARCRSLSYFCPGLHGCADWKWRARTNSRCQNCPHRFALRRTLVIGPVRRVGGSPSQGVAVRSLCGVLLLRLLRPNSAAAITREQRSKPRLTVSQRQQAAPEASH